MINLDFKFPKSRVISNVNALEIIPELLCVSKTKKPLIITDKGIIKAGLLLRLKAILDKAGIQYTVFDDIKENPSNEDVNSVLDYCNTNNNDIFIGFGGGSSMDVAKAAAMQKTNPNVFIDHNFDNKPFPVISCPTTVGTGAEISDVAVFSDENKKKTSLINDKISPDYAVLDPKLLSTLPKKLAVSVGVDCLDHNLAYYFSKSAITISEAINETATCLIIKYLPIFAEDRTNIIAAQNMQIASVMGQIVFSRPKLGICHAVAHALSQLFDIPHSLGVYIILPYSILYNHDYIINKLDKLGKLMQIEDSSNLENSIDYFMGKIKGIYSITDDLAKSIKDLGISPVDISAIAKVALTNRHVTVNPRPVIEEEVVQLLNDCYNGVFHEKDVY